MLQVGLINVDGYYDSLLTFFDKAVDDGFIHLAERSIIVSAPTAKELVQKLEVGSSLLLLLNYIAELVHGDSCLSILACFDQDYVPLHDGVVAKANWEAEQVELNTSLKTEIGR